MFTLTGLIDNTKHTLTYNNGTLTGSDIAIKKAQNENKTDHGLLGMWGCTEYPESYLFSEIPAYALCFKFVFDKIISEKNDFTEIPDGAIA